VRALRIVRRLCSFCRPRIHAKRFEAVLATVGAVFVAQRLSIAALGRQVRGRARPKHGIKRVDRLLGNSKLHRELTSWYASLARALLAHVREPVVLLDWTELKDDLYALVACVPFQGRALPILARVHPKKRLGHPRVHADFLDDLARVLPPGSRPVLVADGGFRTPFFDACVARGFDFVIRLRGSNCAAFFGSAGKVSFEKLFASATETARCLGDAKPFASANGAMHRLVLSPATKDVVRRRTAEAEELDYEQRRGLEPWLLVTSFECEPADRIVRIYATRMQIEETFRDTKSVRFGWALGQFRSTSTRRTEVLLLVAALAFVATVLIGAAADSDGLAHAFQANSTKRHRVLSFFTIGNAAIRSRFAIERLVRSAWARLRALRASLLDYRARPRAPTRWASRVSSHGLFCADCGWNGKKYGWPC